MGGIRANIQTIDWKYAVVYDFNTSKEEFIL